MEVPEPMASSVGCPKIEKLRDVGTVAELKERL
jgi:hypothetical protein